MSGEHYNELEKLRKRSNSNWQFLFPAKYTANQSFKTVFYVLKYSNG